MRNWKLKFLKLEMEMEKTLEKIAGSSPGSHLPQCIITLVNFSLYHVISYHGAQFKLGENHWNSARLSTQ